MPQYQKLATHGEHCACVLLAHAVGGSPESVSYPFCLNVLQKRWILDCDHSCIPAAISAWRASRWRGLAHIDATQAILVSNE